MRRILARLRSNHSWPRRPTLSAHLLRQAARGLFGRALHELVSALADDTDLLRERIDRVLAIGATSGADACTGVLAVARHFCFHTGERAAA